MGFFLVHTNVYALLCAKFDGSPFEQKSISAPSYFVQKSSPYVFHAIFILFVLQMTMSKCVYLV